uniref:Large ribosomal subunit protein uL16m n=1 Tax=Entransia fimbriata TaxID=130991 RepID=U5YGP1_9VIRI|nr:ribosomal protein L16 [Entransia fimbriata]AGZ90300.1 ribosomal protein L16 [Entransia fimbriata]
MLYPKRTKFRKYQKGFKGAKLCDGALLSRGKYGIKSLEAGRLSSKVIEATRRSISHSFRRKAKIWVRIFADIPVTKKPAEVRMGKGKGSVDHWIARIVEGQILFEFDGVRAQVAKQAAILASHKLGLSTKFIDLGKPPF